VKYSIGDLFLYQSRTLKTSLTLVTYDDRDDTFELEWRNAGGQFVKTPYSRLMMDSYLRTEVGWSHYPVKQ
jgi:hypothetical protein